MKTKEIDEKFRERELVVAAQQGDCSAFKLLYEHYRDRVYNLICYSLNNDPQLAEDLLQNVFIKVYRALPGFRFESNLATWIHRITLNECQDQNRRRDNQYVPIEAILGSGDYMEINLPPDEKHEYNRVQEIIRQAIMQLSPKLRSVVELKYIEGLSYEEMASVLECSPGTIASRLNRALTELETRLRPLRGLL